MSVENRKHGLPRIEHLRERPGRPCGSSRSSRCWKTSARSTSTGIDWVIVGGESGPGPGRWTRTGSGRSATSAERAGVPFFFKQWGGVRKSRAGRELDGRTYDEMPSRVAKPVMGADERRRAIREIEAFYPAGVAR